MSNKDIILNELLNKQRKTTQVDKKLKYSDLKRIALKIDNSIFGNECSLWTGYITNTNNIAKGVYINFYFNKKKVALHRLLYNNYIGVLNDNEYIKFTCPNKGKCCNLNHLVKYKYNEHQEIPENDTKKDKLNNIDILKVNNIDEFMNYDFSISFD